MKIAAMISVYDEWMLNSCIRSAKHLDKIFVFDGPVGSEGKSGWVHHSVLSAGEKVFYEYYRGIWKSDADKRTDILNEAKAWDEDAWGLWLDGDEILLYGEYLHDLCRRADEETATGGTTIRIVEYDGSVAKCYGKLIKLSAIKKYVMSSYEVELENGMTVALPNVPICSAGGIPIGEIKLKDDPLLSVNRPPVIGEPHLLHRHGLRNPGREVPRLHDKEAEDFEALRKSSETEK